MPFESLRAFIGTSCSFPHVVFEESEALLHRDLCLKGQQGARDRGSRQARCSKGGAVRDYLALKRMLKHTLHDGEERGSLLRREVVLFAK